VQTGLAHRQLFAMEHYEQQPPGVVPDLMTTRRSRPACRWPSPASPPSWMLQGPGA
jgi:hypothetical protein